MISQENFPRIAIFISGTGTNMDIILNKAKSGDLKINPVLVFSDNAGAKGLETARNHGVKTLSFKPKDFESFTHYENKIVEVLGQENIEWIICAGYMRLIKKSLLNSYKNKIINIHPALLPSFPGLKAQEQAFEYGVKITGCTVHFIDDGVDTGAIIMQKEVRVEDNDTLESLTKKIQEAEHDIYWRAISKALEGVEIIGRKVFKKI